MAPQGAAVAYEFRPDLILLDIGMPLINGFEVARQLRAKPGIQRRETHRCLRLWTVEDLKRSREAGFDDFAVKPIHLQKLTDLMRRTRRQDRVQSVD